MNLLFIIVIINYTENYSVLGASEAQILLRLSNLAPSASLDLKGD